MSSSTRTTRSEVVDLCETIHATSPDLPALGARVLGLFLCVRLTLTYLRHNLPQELLAEVYGVSQATASRVIAAYTPLIAQALQEHVPTVEDLDPTAQLIVDGTLLECWSWKNHPELYPGKHRTTGLGVQVACTPRPEPWPGSATPRVDAPTTPRRCAAPACSTSHLRTYPTERGHRGTSATRATSGWA